MDEREIICIVCPSSCHITVKGDKKEVFEVSNHGCRRGEEYAKQEYLSPVRILTTTAKAKGYVSPVISVRTDKSIPKELLFRCMEEIRKIEVEAPFYVGKPVIKDILGTGVNVVLSNC